MGNFEDDIASGSSQSAGSSSLVSSALFELGIERASSVFSLIFAFARDEVSGDEGFQSALFEIFPGIRLTDDVVERLEMAYDLSNASEGDFFSRCERVTSDFSEQREVLLLILTIFLRLANDDGFLSRTHQQRIVQALDAFAITGYEIEQLDSQQRALLREIAGIHSEANGGELYEEQSSSARYFDVLGCEPGCTDQELRARYRELAKKYHPDRAEAQQISQEVRDANDKRFRDIDQAYKVIKRRRERE